MEEDEIFESDELSMDEDKSSYVEDVSDDELSTDPVTGNIIGFVVQRYIWSWCSIYIHRKIQSIC